jgi:hypothetical protein
MNQMNGNGPRCRAAHFGAEGARSRRQFGSAQNNEGSPSKLLEAVSESGTYSTHFLAGDPSDFTVKFYHLTPTRLLDQILREGLDPARSQSSLTGVFLAGSKGTAENYAGMKSVPSIVVEVELPDSLLQFLVPDNVELKDLLDDMDAVERAVHGIGDSDGWRDCTWQQSLQVCDQVACTASIPPGALTPLRPDFRAPTQQEIVKVLRSHPLIKLRHEVQRAFLVGSFAQKVLGVGDIHASSDVDVLLEISAIVGQTPSEVESFYRQRLMKHFVDNAIVGRQDAVHPQWCGRRLDVYITYDADLEERPKVQLEQPAPSSRPRSGSGASRRAM